MTIINNTHEDILFNIDSGIYCDIKGQQCRTVIPADGSAVVDNAMMFLLILNYNFQLSLMNGDVELSYSVADETYFQNIYNLLILQL
jgi:hypothetical protein